MKTRIILPVFASLALCASAAMAQDAPPPPPAAHNGIPGFGPNGPGKEPTKEELAKFQARQGVNIYAREVGELATLEVKLGLTDKQKPLFERWKKIKLAAAKAHADEFAGAKLPGKDKHPSIVDGLKLETKFLKQHLADIEAELPALEALVATLSDDQKLPSRQGRPLAAGIAAGKAPMAVLAPKVIPALTAVMVPAAMSRRHRHSRIYIGVSAQFGGRNRSRVPLRPPAWARERSFYPA